MFISHESGHCQKETWLCRLQSTMLPVFLFPSWERPVVGNLSDIVGPNWELGPNRSATLTGSVGVMGVWEPKKYSVGGWEKIVWEQKK